MDYVLAAIIGGAIGAILMATVTANAVTRLHAQIRAYIDAVDNDFPTLADWLLEELRDIVGR